MKLKYAFVIEKFMYIYCMHISPTIAYLQALPHNTD